MLFNGAFLTCLSFFASAQTLTSDEIKEQLVKDWQRAKTYTLDYLNAMPADKYSFKPIDSIRSFSKQMLHLAQDNFAPLIATATGAQVPEAIKDRDLENCPGAQSKDSVVYFVTISYDFAIQSIKDLSPAKYGEMVSLFKWKETRFAMLEKAFEHQTHHRGQTTIYIRLQGIKPPGERLF
ncbi:MAG: damage-inducible protein DinB [Bacteroidetes bacterium]|nr:MAG: damage-inducible protein DinB [Bacteroidota bacterium]